MKAAGGPSSYYEMLGVPQNADTRTIRAAYLRLMKHHHPDVAESRARAHPDRLARARELNEAFAALRDPERRRRYDEELAKEQQQEQLRRVRLAQAGWPHYSVIRHPPPPPRRFSRTAALLLWLALAGLSAALGWAMMQESGADLRRFTFAEGSEQDPLVLPRPLADVDQAMVRHGVDDFDWIVRSGTMADAASYSRHCFEELARDPRLILLDRCIAFDIAAGWWLGEQRGLYPHPRFSPADMVARHEDGIGLFARDEDTRRRRLLRVRAETVSALAALSFRPPPPARDESRAPEAPPAVSELN
jgi:hypothetical protein